MALLYPWATKEYLLWKMTLGQIILYLNIGMELKYPDPNKKEASGHSTYDEIAAARADLQHKYGAI